MAGERFFDAKEPLPRSPSKKAVWDIPWLILCHGFPMKPNVIIFSMKQPKLLFYFLSREKPLMMQRPDISQIGFREGAGGCF